MNQVRSEGASSTLFQHDRPNKPNRSKFDLSRINNLSLDAGMIVPVDCFPVLPDDVVNIGQKFALDTLPLVQASLTNYKVLVHWYYMKSRDLWKGFKTFITKGRTGTVELEIPKVCISDPLNYNHVLPDVEDFAPDLDYFESTGHVGCSGDIECRGKHSLSSFLGVPNYRDGIYHGDASGVSLAKDYLPYSMKLTDKGSQSVPVDTYNNANQTGLYTVPYGLVNALPFMMYQSIVKHNYVNQNLLQGNTALFPVEGDDDWLLPYSISDNICNYVDGSRSLTSDDVVNYNGVYSSNETKVDLRLLRYAMFDDDYFTSGLPWLQRGDVTTLETDTVATDFALDFSDSISSAVHTSSSEPWNSIDVWYDGDNKDHLSAQTKDLTPVSASSVLKSALEKGKVQFSSVEVAMTANMLRNLIAMSVWQERNARVDGSYNRMIFQHWNSNPNSEEHLPIYIGGTATYINFNTVLQNSQSTSTSALGSTAGFGQASGQDSCQSFHCDDYGYIMGIMIIKPNTTYQQGCERFLCGENVFDDFVQPEFEGLSPQAILNKEVFVSSVLDENDDLFCYQERNTTYKVRMNVNRGLFQCSPDKDRLFGAFTQARWFNSKPVFSYQFCVMSPDNMRRDWLAYPVYPAFRCQFLSEVFIVRSLSYSSQPNTFGF